MAATISDEARKRIEDFVDLNRGKTPEAPTAKLDPRPWRLPDRYPSK